MISNIDLISKVAFQRYFPANAQVGLGHLRQLEVGDKVEEIRAQLERMATGGKQGEQQVTTAIDQTRTIARLSQS